MRNPHTYSGTVKVDNSRDYNLEPISDFFLTEIVSDQICDRTRTGYIASMQANM